MTCAQGLLRLLWGGARSWSATGLAGFSYNYRNELFSYKFILRFGAAPSILIFGCVICLVPGIATKAVMAFPASFTTFQEAPFKPLYFQTKCFLQTQFYKILGL